MNSNVFAAVMWGLISICGANLLAVRLGSDGVGFYLLVGFWALATGLSARYAAKAAA